MSVSVDTDIQALLDGGHARSIVESDARLRALERAWKHAPSEETLEKYLVALLRASNGPHEVTMGDKVLSIWISRNPWNSKTRELVFWTIDKEGFTIHKGWGQNMLKIAHAAAETMFESLL